MFYNQNLDSAAISLLSLSMAASNAAPIPVSKLDGGNAEPNSDSSSNNTQHGRSFSTQLSSPPTSNMSISASNSTTTTTPDFAHKGNLSQSIPASVLASPSQLGTSLANASSSVNGAKHHRRLSSTGRARRRLSDAKDAANRPSSTALQSAALSLASLSLSTSPLGTSGANIPTSLKAALAAAAASTGNLIISDAHLSKSLNSIAADSSSAMGSMSPSSSLTTTTPTNTTTIPIPIGGKQKKRGIDHKCETCSKIYRHPSCLIKHRWEHTPHWKEASKYVLSKHQQVQLLEAAAILSHLSPKSGTSLPEDRSLWPFYLSGGALPPPEGASIPASTNLNQNTHDGGDAAATANNSNHPISSSVPATSASGGPRLHDYSVPPAATAGGLTHLRPGVITVSNSNSDQPNSTSSTGVATPTPPVPVPNGHVHRHLYSNSVDGLSFGAGFGSYGGSSSVGNPYSYANGAYHGGASSLTIDSWEGVHSPSQSLPGGPSSYASHLSANITATGLPASSNSALSSLSVQDAFNRHHISASMSSVRSMSSRSRSGSAASIGASGASASLGEGSSSTNSNPSDEGDDNDDNIEVDVIIDDGEAERDGVRIDIDASMALHDAFDDEDDREDGTVSMAAGRYSRRQRRPSSKASSLTNIYNTVTTSSSYPTPLRRGRRPRRGSMAGGEDDFVAVKEEDEDLDDVGAGLGGGRMRMLGTGTRRMSTGNNPLKTSYAQVSARPANGAATSHGGASQWDDDDMVVGMDMD